MNEFLQISTGKIVHFYSALSYSGINVSVYSELTSEEKKLFKKELSQERDVVSIYYEQKESA